MPEVSKLRRSGLLAGLLIVTAVNTAAATGPASGILSPYTATYSGKFSGAALVIETRLDALAEPQQYRLGRYSETRGMARLIRREPVRECALFRVGTSVQATTYEFLDDADGGGKSSTIEFDWQAGTANSRYQSESRVLEVKPGTLDHFSEEVAVRLLLAGGTEPGELTVVERNAVHTVSYRRIGVETLQTSLGELRTIRYQRRRGTSSRTTDFWYAPDLQWLPVRIERSRKGKSQGQANIRSLSWIDDSGQARGNVTPVCP